MFEGNYITECKEFKIVVADIKSEIASFGTEIPALQNPIDAEDQIWERNARIFDKRKWLKDSLLDLRKYMHVGGVEVYVSPTRQIEYLGIVFKIDSRVKVIKGKEDYLLKNFALEKMPEDIRIVGFIEKDTRVVMQIEDGRVFDFGIDLFTGQPGIDTIFEIVKE